ncbi:MAG: hemolysin family protein [Balneolales bacterium]|nr:hemolysin family protein [Balneolales bacterium]
MEPPSFSLSILLLLQQNSVEATDAIGMIDPAETLIQILVIILGLILSAFFSGSEVAFFSRENQTRFSQNENEKALDSADLRVKKLLSDPRKLLATILIGNTFANIITAVFAAVLTGKFVEFYGLDKWIVFTAEILVLTFTIVILTEITPKVLALKNAYSFSRSLSAPLSFFYWLFSPFARLIAKSTARLESRIPKVAEKLSSEDIKAMAEVGEMQGTLRGEEREIIENVADFGNITVKEIMTSRVNMVAISTDATLEDVLSVIREKSISRFPLYENDLDNIKGVLHAKDILPFLLHNESTGLVNWQANARKALFIPTTKKIDDLLRDFQREKTHVAIVVDEYGGTEGLVTMDDILEEIIGEMHDEHSDNEQLYERTPEGDYIFDAKIDLDEVGEILNRELTSSDDEYETLGGLIYHLAERIPDQGDQHMFLELQLTVEEIENNRLKKIRIREQPSSDVENDAPEKSTKE